MERILGTMVLLILLAFIMEIVDSSLGMMYGTLLSPLLMGFGFEPLLVVPAILLSQAIGGLGGTYSHHRYHNANFNGLTRDTKIVLAMVVPGLIVVMVGVVAAINLPGFYVKVYIGTLVIIMSLLCILPMSFIFAWWKHYVIGMLAAFNKSLSGGGFGPVTSTGGIIGGLESKVSIATTTFAEFFICFFAFVLYLVLSGGVDGVLVGLLCVGAVFGSLVGPYISSKLDHHRLRMSIGILGMISGAWLLWNLI